MRRISYIRLLVAIVLTSITMFMVSMHEVHYLFSEHHEHEHCGEQHLHGTDEHSHCPVCKFDISFFTDEISQPGIQIAQSPVSRYTYTYQSISIQQQVTAHTLRGPPVTA